jgi:hypothetical protein
LEHFERTVTIEPIKIGGKLMEQNTEALKKLSEMLEKDEDFRKKLHQVFDTNEKVTFQVLEKDSENDKGGCSCSAYSCGKGCFSSYPGSRGYSLG